MSFDLSQAKAKRQEGSSGSGRFLLISLPLSEFLCPDGAAANPVPLVNSFGIRSLDFPGENRFYFPPISVIS